MANPAAFRAIIHGHVQGVFFRAVVFERANELGLTGYVRNLPSGREVEVRAEGERELLEKLIELVKVGPPLARVDHISVKWSNCKGEFHRFTVRD